MNVRSRMPPSLPSHRTLLLSRYAYDLGVPLTDFLVRLNLCTADLATAHIVAGAFRLNGRVMDDPNQLIRTTDLGAGSIAELFDQRVTLGFWTDEESAFPTTPPTRALLLVHALDRWEEFNEYEGSCRATWNGREYCFRVILVGEEWNRVRVGFTWEADIYFDCDSPVEILDHAPSLVPGLTPVAGVNYSLCGRILRQVEEGVLVAIPQTLTVALEHCKRQGGDVLRGRWVRSAGSLQARMPD